jgi:type I restriction enzyme S subunit
VSNVDKVPSEDETPVRLCNYTDVYYNEHLRPDMGVMETTATQQEIDYFGLGIGDVLITKDSEEWSDIAVPALVVATAPDFICGYHLAIIRPDTRKLVGTFLLRAFQSGAVNQQFQIAATGVTRYGLPKSAIDFLQYETAKIDRLIEKKRVLIEKLKERRSALISRTVTRGLPPAASRGAGLDPHPLLKPSGVEWLGEIPSHWSSSRLKYAASRIVDCPHETPQYMDDGEYTVIRTADLSSGKLDLSAAYHVEEEEYQKRIRREPLIAGDIVYGREGERWGFAATVPNSAGLCLGQRMMQFRAAGHFDQSFLMWQLNSDNVYQQGAVDIVGATSPHVNVETIRNYWLTEPPLDEQKAIAEYIDSEATQIDRITIQIKQVIQRLQEYRTALITSAVTGKFDVGGETA